MTDTPKPRTPSKRRTTNRRPNPQDGDDRGRTAPSQEEIRRKAYELYEKRGGQPGRDKEDWERAESELRGRE